MSSLAAASPRAGSNGHGLVDLDAHRQPSAPQRYPCGPLGRGRTPRHSSQSSKPGQNSAKCTIEVPLSTATEPSSRFFAASPFEIGPKTPRAKPRAAERSCISPSFDQISPNGFKKGPPETIRGAQMHLKAQSSLALRVPGRRIELRLPKRTKAKRVQKSQTPTGGLGAKRPTRRRCLPLQQAPAGAEHVKRRFCAHLHRQRKAGAQGIVKPRCEGGDTPMRKGQSPQH